MRAQTLISMCSWIEKISLEKVSALVIPALKNSASDSNNNVKLALAKLLGVMSASCGEELTANKL